MMTGVIFMENFKSGNSKFMFRVTVFLLALLFTLYELSLLLMPKSFFNAAYPNTSSLLGFYKLPKDSVDVIFLGSSHAIAGFDTQELYDSYGIRGYNLGSGEQNILISYYYLMETLKTQNPKVVVLDTLMLFPFRKDKLLYSSSASAEGALKFLKPGINKFKAMMEMCEYDDELTVSGMFLPFFSQVSLILSRNSITGSEITVFSLLSFLSNGAYSKSSPTILPYLVL